MRLRRGRVAAGTLGVLGLVAGTTSLVVPSAQGVVVAAAVPSTYLSQKLSWKECYPGKGYPQLQCAVMRTPRDWNRPTAGGISVVLSRVAAKNASKRRGVLFTNPGGPGESGLMLPLYLSLTEPDVAAAYDLVGMDPRGAGSSTRLNCADPAILDRAMALDGRNPSGAVQMRILAASKAYATACGKVPYTKLVNTFQTVRDMNLMRGLLKVNKLSYVGYSAGTWLGAWFATTFPTRVDRFVLDGNLEFTAPLYRSFSRQPTAFQFSFERYFQPWAAKYDSLLGLGATGADVKRTYEARRAALARTPLTLPDRTVLNASRYDAGIASALYWTGAYPDLGAALAIIENWSQATADEKEIVVDVFGGGTSGGQDAFWSIVCGDSKNPSVATVQKDTATFRRTAPLIGANWNVDPCMYWPLPTLTPPMTGKGLPPMLMLNNAADPATPLANARAARARTPNARLVTVSGQPDHTIFGQGAPCVENVARAWLLRGVLPKADLVCAGLPLPDPTADTPSDGSSASSGASVGVRGAITASVGEERQRGVATAAPAVLWSERLAETIGEPAVDVAPAG